MEHSINKIGFVLYTVLAIGISLLKPIFANAQYYPQNDIKKIVSIDKKIKLNSDNTFLDNISETEHVFVDGDTIEFEIIVTNIGREDLVDLKISDVMPKYLSLIFNPGSFDKDSNTINWNLDKLLPGQSKTYNIRAKISGVDNTDINYYLKLTNKGFVTVDDVSDQDFASYFVSKKVVPNTGDNSLPIKTTILFSVCASALYFRKLARGF